MAATDEEKKTHCLFRFFSPSLLFSSLTAHTLNIHARSAANEFYEPSRFVEFFLFERHQDQVGRNGAIGVIGVVGYARRVAARHPQRPDAARQQRRQQQHQPQQPRHEQQQWRWRPELADPELPLAALAQGRCWRVETAPARAPHSTHLV